MSAILVGPPPELIAAENWLSSPNQVTVVSQEPEVSYKC